MKRLFELSDNKCGRLHIDNDFECTNDFANIMGQMANDFTDQLSKITKSAVKKIDNVSLKNHINNTQKLDDIQNLLELLVEFYFMQAEYEKNKSGIENTEIAASTCKKAISLMLSFQVKYSSIPYELFESAYQWLLYVSMLITLPESLKDKVELRAEYSEPFANYRYDICILNKKTKKSIVVVECDGETNHIDNIENYEKQCIRQNDIALNVDCTLLRYSNKQIYNDSFKISQEIWDNILNKQSELEFDKRKESDASNNDNSQKELYPDYNNLNFITRIKLFFKLLKLMI